MSSRPIRLALRVESRHDRAMVPIFAKTDKLVQSMSGWAWLFGAVAGLSAWLGKKVTLFGPIGWPEAILFGVGVAVAVSLTASIAMLAWRVLRPLPPSLSDARREDAPDFPWEEVNVAVRREVANLGLNAPAPQLTPDQIENIVARFPRFQKVARAADFVIQNCRSEIAKELAAQARAFVEKAKANPGQEIVNAGMADPLRNYLRMLATLGYSSQKLSEDMERIKAAHLADAIHLLPEPGDQLAGERKRQWRISIANFEHVIRILEGMQSRPHAAMNFLETLPVIDPQA